MDSKIVYSAVQPSGELTIGNLLGSIQNWLSLQEDYSCYFAIADLHAITVRQDPARLRERTLSLAALYLALGLDPKKTTLYVQSQVLEHAALCWVLNSLSYVGEMERMTQFKDKSLKHADNINMGLMDYPVLMAADILLYQTDLVPVGADQTQHLEISRDIAIRFNNRYGETFRVPKAHTLKLGAKICSLQEPTKKMSKSDENLNASIFLNDPPEVIMKKFKRAVTDSDNSIRFSPEKPGVSNLLAIYAAFQKCTVEEAEKNFEGCGYGTLKTGVAEAVSNVLEPIQKERERLLKDEGYLISLLKEGASKAREKAQKTLSSVYDKVGFLKG